MKKSRIRIGAVPYLNGKPLVAGYHQHRDQADFIFEVPSRLATLLALGELDAALLSSVEYLRGGYVVLPHVGIISRGAVNSVVLVGNQPIEQAQVVYLDPASRTSCVLTALWYSLRINRIPDFRVASEPKNHGSEPYAQLLIGDRGLVASRIASHQVDLGAAWEEWTGLPFVYAVWLVRHGVNLGSIADFLIHAPSRNEKLRLVMAEEASRNLGLNNQQCIEYLTHSLHFCMDQKALMGMETFLNLAAENQTFLRSVLPDFPQSPLPTPVPVELYQFDSHGQIAAS